jgi:hypothetical protein
MLYKTSGDGGIFLWDRDVLGPLEKSHFNDCLKEKQLHMVGYLCELCLDLAVCPENTYRKVLALRLSSGYERCPPTV